MYRLCGMSFSGNCYLALNPNGKVPTLQLETGEHLSESNAILCYLADGMRYWPEERLARAQTL